MMKKLLLLGLGALLASAAWSIPTMQGWSGGLQVPTADIQQGITLTVDQSLSEGYGPAFTRRPSSPATSIPQTQLLFGVVPGLEFGVGITRYQGSGIDFTKGPAIGDFTETQAAVKYALPWTFQKAKLAVGLAYDTYKIPGIPIGQFTRVTLGDTTFTNWSMLVCGTLPLAPTIDGTAAVIFNHAKLSNDIPEPPFSRDVASMTNDSTTFAFGLEKRFQNQTRLGLEYLFNAPYSIGINSGDDIGNAYVTFPINEMLTGRVALTGITEDTSFLLGVSAKL
jgi:hypothetical protein